MSRHFVNSNTVSTGLELKPGDHMPGDWTRLGAWLEYASGRGVKCTAITISQVSRRLSERKGQKTWLRLGDHLRRPSELTCPIESTMAIVIMGVIEHLPQYDRVVRKFMSCLKPGGKIFLDGSANIKRYQLSSFMVKYIYPGNHSFLILHEFLEQLAKTRRCELRSCSMIDRVIS